MGEETRRCNSNHLFGFAAYWGVEMCTAKYREYNEPANKIGELKGSVLCSL